jgi:Cu(I)/Ag(I) efflux system membrane fusion protein
MKEKMKSIRNIVLAGLAAALTIAACNQKQPAKKLATAQKLSDVKYTCPMHPQIMEDHPGSCPICGMNLVKKSGQASEGAGISLNTVLQPVNSSVIASINAINPQQKVLATQIQADGYLDFDTRTFNNIAAHFSGRIEKLYIKYAFQEIHSGQRIFDIYSPDMVTAQQDLLYLVKNSPQETGIIDAAKQKLLLLGMTLTQVSKLVKTGKPFYSLPVYSPYDGHVHDVAHTQMAGTNEVKPLENYNNNVPLSIREGMYVEKGQNIFNVVDPHRLWAIIKVDRSAISGLKLNQQVNISLPDMPNITIAGKVGFIEPFLQPGDKNTSIRIYVQNTDHEFKVNSLVKATIQSGSINGLWIPRAALIDLGLTQLVWLKDGPIYKAHLVNVGAVNGSEIQITKGLSQADSIAENAQYLTDSESFIKIQGNK